MKRIMLILLLVFALLPFVSARTEHNATLYIFHGQGCPHCAKALEFLESIGDKYPSLTIKDYEVYFNDANRKIFLDLARRFNSKVEGVPTIFIGSKIHVGFSPEIAKEIEGDIQHCVNDGCVDSFDYDANKAGREKESKDKMKSALSLTAVISGALVDSINPCAFAVLILLLTTILVSKNRKRALVAGFAFSGSIFISYYLMGLGLYSAIQVLGLSRIVYTVVAILAIIIGLFNLKDYLWYGKWFVMEVPFSWRPRLKKLIRGITSPMGAFMIGFLVSLFLLPCTSGPYIVILGMLSKLATRNYALLLLLLYNAIFILPMIIITLLVYLGFTTTEKAERFRTKHLKSLHLVAGLILLLLGVGLLMALKFGWV